MVLSKEGFGVALGLCLVVLLRSMLVNGFEVVVVAFEGAVTGSVCCGLFLRGNLTPVLEIAAGK